MEYSENWFVLFIFPLQDVGLTYLKDDLGFSMSGVECLGYDIFTGLVTLTSVSSLFLT